MVVDKVCGLMVNEETSKSFCYGGKTFYFCSNECQSEFKSDPKAYLPAVLTEKITRELKSISSRGNN